MRYIYCTKCGKQLEPSDSTVAVPIRTVITYYPDGEKKEEYYCLFCFPDKESE